MTVVPAALLSERLASAAGWMAHIGAAGLVRSADLVQFAPALTWRVAPPSWVAIVAYYGAGAVWWTLWRQRLAGAGSQEPARTGAIRRTAGGIAVAAGLWMLVNPLALLAVRGDGALHATFIDVGQGDSIFVTFPRGTTMLVDAGGLSAGSSFDIGDRVVAPVIRHAGFRRIDYLVLTHGDPDHIGGAGAILREFRPREVWEGIPVPRFEALTALRVATQQSRGPLGECLRRGSARRGRRRGRRAPPAPRRVGAPEGPQRRFDRARAALARALGALDRRHRPCGGARDQCDDSGGAPRVVKVPHHGSLTSSAPEFLAAIRPQLAVVSAGRGNHFGHPVPDVLDRYTAIGAEVFRTDRDGAVTMDSDGYSIDVRTFTGRRLSVR
jgi:competence protein ComEC